jgi:hypothetical protein
MLWCIYNNTNFVNLTLNLLCCVAAGVGDPDEGWHWHYSKRGWRMDRSAWAHESGALLYIYNIFSSILSLADSFPHVNRHDTRTYQVSPVTLSWCLFCAYPLEL